MKPWFDVRHSPQSIPPVSPVLLAALFTTALGLAIMLVASVLGHSIAIIPAFVIAGVVVFVSSVAGWVHDRRHP